MNLADYRLHILERLDWQPDQSTTFVAKANRLIERAHQALFNEAPYLYEDVITLVTYPQVTNASGVATDVLNVNTSDDLVMERASTDADRTAWVFNGTWDGRFVEITDSSGQVHRRQCREFWADGQNNVERFTIDEPWPNTADTGMTYRIHTPEYHLPGDVVEIRSAKPFTDPNHSLTVISQYDAERYRLLDYRGDATGLPSTVYRGQPFQIDAPTLAPTVNTDAKSTWADTIDTDNAGTFDYVYTYVWGNKDPDYFSPHGLADVVWESAPSPISSTATTTNGGNIITINTPIVDWMYNFNLSTAPRDGRSGLRKRIYARRTTSDATGTNSKIVESPNVFMQLAEVAGDVEEYIHDGTALLDYRRRLKHSRGYHAVKFFPSPDARYEIDFRCLVRPNPLVNDQDTPLVPVDAAEALIYRALMLFYEMDGKPEMVAYAEGRYRTELETLTKRYGAIAHYKSSKRPARVRRRRPGDRSRIVTYSGIT